MSNEYELKFSGEAKDLQPLLAAITHSFGRAPARITDQINYSVSIVTFVETEQMVKTELGDFPNIDITITRVRQES